MNALPIAVLPCWIFLQIAGWLVRPRDRDEWRQEWLSELWYRWNALRAVGAWNKQSAIQLYCSAAGSFCDAWYQLTSDEDRWTALRARTRTPAFCAALLAAGLILVAIGSDYFSATRSILTTLPYEYAPRVALVSRTGRLQAIHTGIPGSLAGFWFHDSKLIEAMAICSFAHPASTQIAGRSIEATSLQATPNLLDVLGEPVSPQIREALNSGVPVALLSFSFWQREFHSDPKVVGTWLRRNHSSVFIAGVLPPHFWFVSSAVQIYELRGRAFSGQGILVVRSKPGVSARQLEDDIFKIAERNDLPFVQTAPHVLFLTDALHTPVWLFGASLLIALVLVGIGHGTRFHRNDRGKARLPSGNLRWWLFLLAKTAVALLLVFTTGLEFFVRLSHQLTTEPLGGPALLWFYIAGCSAVVFAVFADQRSRCRVCLQCLAFPIRVGCPGCLFLDWSGTEFLCPDGHGVLYVPHHVSCWDEADRWVALEM